MTEPSSGSATAPSEPGPLALDDFERSLLEAIARATPDDGVLREQTGGASVVRRDADVSGRTTYLCVAAGAARAAEGELTLRYRVRLADAPDASAELTLHNGWLDSLYVGVADGTWPERPELRDVTVE